MRIFALSDIHVDYDDNLAWIKNLSSADYTKDTLLLAGDASHDQDTLADALESLRAKFERIFFVPGNHDLWLRTARFNDSMEKLGAVLKLCQKLDVLTNPARIDCGGERTGVWIVPLYAWYEKPEESSGSLFVPKMGEDPALKMWADNKEVKWPPFVNGITAAEHFLGLNSRHLDRQYEAAVISFSHFLPRQELMFKTKRKIKKVRPSAADPLPEFNFSRVAGCTGLDEQIRQLGSTVHVYGHQHRNHQHQIDDVFYISHCLGYPQERAKGHISGINNGPKLIWGD